MEKLIIAHRGASGYEKENTLAAFQKAVELGADMVEFDVRRTRDGELVVIHDSKVEGQKICELSYEEVKNISKRLGFGVPKLEELLVLLKNKIKLDIELKEEGCETETVELALRYFDKSEFIMTSFKKNSLRIVKKKFPDIRTGLLLGGRGETGKIFRAYLDGLFSFGAAKKIDADYILPQWTLAILPFYLMMLQCIGLPVIVWTVDRQKTAARFLKHKNVAGIITDYPDLLYRRKENRKY
ncbi:MAG: glycerophosphodiester phosphodiesterase [Candidatus Pacebacteria bacterium]|nr:glycerophosphodiester phosphodiesterase [Candidatus Paceibacterota bacterium]MDR3583653.1 glycerophosphodiester phosphodiesterase [Candidatus Paceibacterota bacterium]